jgi:hypothetical protein
MPAKRELIIVFNYNLILSSRRIALSLARAVCPKVTLFPLELTIRVRFLNVRLLLFRTCVQLCMSAIDCAEEIAMASTRTGGFSPTVFRNKFHAGMTVRSYRDKEVIFSQGDVADAIFYIHTGTVTLTAVSTRRKKAVIAFLYRGSFFGEGCLGGQSLRICTARSIGQSNITRLQKGARLARSSETRSLQRCLLHICFPG